MTQLRETATQRTFAPGVRFVMGDGLGDLAEVVVPGTAQLLFSPEDTNYTPGASFEPQQAAEQVPATPVTTNSLIFDIQGDDTYSPSATFTPTETTQDSVNQVAATSRIYDGLIFRFPQSIEVGIANKPRSTGHAISVEVYGGAYTPEPSFNMGPFNAVTFRFDGGKYTPLPEFRFPAPKLGELDDEPVLLNADIVGLIAGPVGEFGGSYANNQADVVGTISMLTGDIAGEYDYNVQRLTTGASLSNLQNTTKSVAAAASKSENAVAMTTPIKSVQQIAESAANGTGIVVDIASFMAESRNAAQEFGSKASNSIDSELQQLTVKNDEPVSSSQAFASKVSDGRTALFDLLVFKRPDWDASQENTFDTQLRHKRTYYNPVEPWVDYTPQPTFTFDTDNSPGSDPGINVNYDREYAFEPTQIAAGSVGTQIVWQQNVLNFDMTDAAISESSGVFDFEILETARTGTLLNVPVVTGDMTFVVTQHELPASAVPVPANPRPEPGGIMDEIIHPGLVEYGTYAWSDTKGTLHRSSFSMRQHGTWKCKKWRSELEEAMKPLPGKSPWIDYPRPPVTTTPPSGSITRVAKKEVYTMLNTMSVTLENLTPINMDNLIVKFDAESYAWSFSGDLLSVADMASIQPNNQGEPVKLIVTINGYSWTVIVDSISREREFGKQTIKVLGRTQNALLTEPYYSPTTGSQGALMALSQLMASHLPVDWTLDYQLPAWNVDGGAYSWQNRTPLQAIYDLAQYAGAMVIPDRNSKILRVQPRYAVLPWNYDAVTADISIPEDVIVGVVYRQVSKQYPNGVYVHGGEVGGEIGFCRLNGTAGDVLIQAQQNPVMTDVVGLRALGERLLAAEYTQPEISSIKIPMDGSQVPMVNIGELVEIDMDGETQKGIASAIEINAKLNEVTQTVSLGEDSGNSWLAFKRLLPADPLLLGTLASTSGNSSIVNLLGGGSMTVRGTGTVGNNYYIRSGQIQGDAPVMTEHEIVI